MVFLWDLQHSLPLMHWSASEGQSLQPSPLVKISPVVTLKNRQCMQYLCYHLQQHGYTLEPRVHYLYTVIIMMTIITAVVNIITQR